MKRLTLVRHANAEWKNPKSSDFDRSLSRRGQVEAEALARHLLERRLLPDLMMASSALRAKQTSEILARQLELPGNTLKFEEQLYLAEPEEILRTIKSVGPKVQHLTIVGHNPGISDCARLLAPEASLPEFPTAAACTMTFAARTWREVTPGSAADAHMETRPPRLFGLWA